MAAKTQAAPGRRTFKYLKATELRQLKDLLFASKLIVEGAYAGQHRSPFKGSSAEFIDYREYYPGDEIRTIDWKAYARTDRYFIKLFEKETDMNCYLLVDRSASMAYGGKEYQMLLPEADVTKLEYACLLAASLAYLMVQQSDKVGMSLFAERITQHVPVGGTFSHLYTILNVLERQHAGGRTSVARVLREAFGLFQRRGLLVVISDFLSDPSDIFRALSMYRHRGFEVILFHVMHRYEATLPPLESIHFIDSESGEQIPTQTEDIRGAYEARVLEFTRSMAAYARAKRIDYNFVTTETPPSAAIRKYVSQRDRVR